MGRALDPTGAAPGSIAGRDQQRSTKNATSRPIAASSIALPA
jgi:hypothetical protein